MKVWDSRTQQLTPEWLAHSSLAKNLKLGDVLATGSGPARVVKLTPHSAGGMSIEIEFLTNGGWSRGQMVLSDDARLELHEDQNGGGK